MSDRLADALARVRARQPANWAKAENAVSRFIADLPEGSRVLCLGVVRAHDKDLPGALLYSSKSDDVAAIASDGIESGIEIYGPSLFWSNIPYESIAREVLAGPEGTVIASGTEARRAETPQSGSVHDGPAAEGGTPNLRIPTSEGE